MASISSTNSSSSLGNTSLRGFGGMVSGIDRDSIVEQMTLGTTTKINNQKKAMTQLQWKQEAYRGVSDKIIDWADKYASYSSSSNLKDAMVFAKSQITVHGSDYSSKFVTATGTSQMINNVSLLGVGKMATSTVRRSDTYGSTELKTGLKGLDDLTTNSKLKGATLSFGYYSNVDGDTGWKNVTTFKFPDGSFTYTDKDGKEHKETIDYVNDSNEEIVRKLNAYLEHIEDKSIGDTSMKDAFQFECVKQSGTGVDTKDQIRLVAKGEGLGGYVIQGGSALSAFGISSDDYDSKSGLTLDQFNEKMGNDFKESSHYYTTALDNMTGQKLTFTYDGSAKSIELITREEAEQLKGLTVKGALEHLSEDEQTALNALIADGTVTEETKIGDSTDPTVKALLQKAQNNMMASNLNTRLSRAYGAGTVEAKFDENDGLKFTVKAGSSLSITSSDSELLSNLGLEYGSSNKVNLNGKLSQDAINVKDSEMSGYLNEKGELDLVINGVAIGGLTANSSISDILSKINSSDAGVKATYVDATGEFMLVSSETGAGRQVSMDSDLAKRLFVGHDANGEKIVGGENAEIYVSYGDGNAIKLERSSNTFNLEGLNVTVSGVFGGITNDGTNIGWDPSQTITFTAKADVDGVTEKVKSFFEDFNALVTEISSQVRTRPDSSYGPLTDEQKAEMDETSIENWEKKAKQGLLYGDSAMRDLSADVETIFTKLMMDGASYEDLKEIGITYSEDYLDGGTLVFDESKFRDAMENDPDKVANIFTGGGGVGKGLVNVIDETFTPYATRYASKNGNSYGRLIEIAGSEKKPTTLMENEIYKQLKEMEDTIASLQDRLKVEQDRYISQFTTMESLINQMNTQQSYLSQITG